MASNCKQGRDDLLSVEFEGLGLTNSAWTQTGISFQSLVDNIGAGGTSYACNTCLALESEKVVAEPAVQVSRYVQTDIVELITVEEDEPEKPAR